MDTIVEYLSNLSKSKPDTSWYFADTDSTTTVAELKQLVDEYTAKFQSLGLAEGAAVGLALPNSIELVACLYACWQNRLVTVPLRTKSGKYYVYNHFLKGCHRFCDFSLIVCADSFPAEITSEWNSKLDVSVLRLADFNKIKARTPFQFKQILPSDIAIIQFSSGSTGFPKGVIVTHQMAINQLQHLYHQHTVNCGASCNNSASWTPINHDMGLFTGVLYPIYTGCNNILATPDYYMRNPPRWFKLLSIAKTDVTFTTNAALAVALRSIKRLYDQADVDLTELHLYISAEKISSNTLKKARAALAPIGLHSDRINTAYGMAENSLGASVSRMGQLKIKSVVISELGQVTFVDESYPNAISLVSSGYPNERHEITVRGDNDEILPPMQIGEFNIKSDCLTPGYINRPDINSTILANERFRTGDLGFISDGELYFYSRKDDLVVYNGRNIIPEDIEESVEMLDFVRAGASVLLAWEHQRTGIMGLHIVVETSAISSPEEIAQKQHAILNELAQAHDVVVSKVYLCAKGSIEKTSSGKKRRKVIQERLRNGQLDVHEAELELAS